MIAWEAIIFGILGLSAILTYGLWVQVRVVRLRQDIFDIRDELFDACVRTNTFHDPGCRLARELLNVVARDAEDINLLSLLHYIATSSPSEEQQVIRCESELAQRLVDSAIDRASSRLVDYLLRESLSGWLASAMVSLQRAEEESLRRRVGGAVTTRLAGAC